MTSEMFQEILKCVIVLGGLLLLGTFLRAKVPLFQKLLLPASVIGGFVGLLLGPTVMGKYAVLRVPEEWVNIWSLIPGLLIIPIFSSTPLGMFKSRKIPGQAEMKGAKSKTAGCIFMTLGITAAAAFSQNVTGYGINMVFKKLFPSMDIYRTFGWELREGFCGGHGTAGAVGSILEGYGLPYWKTAQGVAMTTATAGLIGGMLLGILFINRASRKGKLTCFDTSKKALPAEVLKGYVNREEEQKSMGRQVTTSSSVETLTIHLALILGGCGIAFLVQGMLGKVSAAFGKIPVWFYGIIVMYGVNYAIQKLNLTWMVDKKVKSSIIGSLSDFAITAAIASVPVKAVFAYMGPLLVMCGVGFAVTYLITFPLFKFCFRKDYAFERAIVTWGTNTGVMVTGLMLLRICDPDYETPSLKDFTMCYPLISVLSIALSPIYYGLIATGSTFENFLFALVCMVVFLAIALAARGFYYRDDEKKHREAVG